MRETSYHAVIAEMTVRSLWETQNVMGYCIPDELWQRLYGGAPLWQHLYHALHSLDQWFINPKATDFVEPPIHTPHLQDLAIYPSACVDRAQMDEYFYTIKAKLSMYLTSLHDEDLLQRPENCEWTRFTLILSAVSPSAHPSGDADGLHRGRDRPVPPHAGSGGSRSHSRPTTPTVRPDLENPGKDPL